MMADGINNGTDGRPKQWCSDVRLVGVMGGKEKEEGKRGKKNEAREEVAEAEEEEE